MTYCHFVFVFILAIHIVQSYSTFCYYSLSNNEFQFEMLYSFKLMISIFPVAMQLSWSKKVKTHPENK